MMPSLAERLKNLGVKPGNEIPAPEKEKNRPLVEILNGQVLQNTLGSTILLQQQYPYGYRHGDIEFHDVVNTESIHQVGKLGMHIESLKKMVFLDTETTGLSGGTGTLAFLVGMAQFDDQGLVLRQLIVDDPYDEAAMLVEFGNLCKGVEAVITYNGKSFDLPILRSRYILNRLAIPFLEWGHLDLLHLSRRIWRQRLESRGLKDLEREILHLPRSEEEVPGWMIPEIYANYLRSGDGTQVANIVYHNAMDIVSLAALYLKINTMLDEEILDKKIHALDAFSIGQIYAKIGEFNKAISIFEQCLKNNHSTPPLRVDISSQLAYLYRKTEKIDKSIELWKTNSSAGNFQASIELAKYFEHEIKDYDTALHWTNCAQNNLDNSKIVGYKNKKLTVEIDKRRQRLEKRIKHVSQKNS